MLDEIKKGLAGVVVDTTAISKVNPDTNSLLYRGYPVQELAARCTFEEVAYLLWHGELPTDAELAAFETLERSHRRLDPIVKDAIDALPLSAHPMDVVRTAVSVIGALDESLTTDRTWIDLDLTLERSIRLFAQLPAIVAYTQRRLRDERLVEPRDDLGYSANFLHMTFGEVPEKVVVDAFDVSMILYAEHSFNASTFAARVITSTLSDVYSAVTGAIGALKGPLHGGANEAVLDMLARIRDSGEGVERFVERVKNKEDGIKLMGFGHRVYKSYDPRAKLVKASVDAVLADLGVSNPLLEIARELEAIALADEYFIERKLYPNVDFYTGVIYKAMGFPTRMFTVLFAIGRLPGWIAHWREMNDDPSTKIGRPQQLYIGSPARDWPQR